VPIDLLRVTDKKKNNHRMKDFRTALIWHMEQKNTRMTELARGAGVSLDILKKLKTRPTASTNAETATKIAAYYGKSVAEFIKCDENTRPKDDISELLNLLSDQEQEFLLKQIRGLLSMRD